MICATDINPHAMLSAHARGVAVVRTDFAAGFRRVFTLVLFNPPYIPTRPDERLNDWLEYALDGGPDGRGPLTRFLHLVPDVLIPGGRVLIVISSLQHFEKCEEIFGNTGFSYTIADHEILEDGEELIIYRLKRD